ncbi:hypothetical protein K503DRAFT_770052 [Rhizopogon vinicolor AM-OR11-026]|uniref:DUF6534 domain-containing protein n=1 Tax=Rhizopogon vinicolor AM-OR11-026 TaxID=1314800 RepID=A0A1B7N1V3_9AGAM|nr:hypothetical protein K503DRAFT_770052 [Rhizopogon vinicolor AM-OR11-026]
MVDYSTDLVWGPGLIGFTIATAFYGTAFGQFIFYMQSFPRDTKKFKLFIMMVFSFGTLHQYALIGMFWSILISCRRSTSLQCTDELPWQMLLAVVVSTWIIFAVQCFYAHRVWIITEYNRLITGIICALAAASLIFGMITGGLLLRSRSPEVLFGTKWTQFATLANALCDIIITATVWWFLRPARTGNVRSKSKNYINELTRIFVEMGLFSCLVAITMAVFYQFQNGVIGRYYSAAPGALIGKTYLNSMMAVLNARKSIRERKEVDDSTMELPTIPTIR